MSSAERIRTFWATHSIASGAPKSISSQVWPLTLSKTAVDSALASRLISMTALLHCRLAWTPLPTATRSTLCQRMDSMLSKRRSRIHSKTRSSTSHD